jgi:hypothetical protein
VRHPRALRGIGQGRKGVKAGKHGVILGLAVRIARGGAKRIIYALRRGLIAPCGDQWRCGEKGSRPGGGVADEEGLFTAGRR